LELSGESEKFVVKNLNRDLAFIFDFWVDHAAQQVIDTEIEEID
jgi:hypothetical protein